MQHEAVGWLLDVMRPLRVVSRPEVAGLADAVSDEAIGVAGAV